MRKTFWTISVLLLISAIGAPRSHADSFTYSFVGASLLNGTNFTVVDTSGPALFNVNLAPLLASPSDLFIAGIDFGPLTTIGFTGTPAFPIGTVLASNFNAATAVFTNNFDPAVAGAYPTDFGTLTVAVTPVVTPEPSSVVLMLIGIGLVLLLRKRNSRGHQLAT